MAGTRTNALVSAGASAFVMCAFMVRDTSRSEAQIVSYVVSGVGFLGAGVIFKDAGSVRGLNTAATLRCSAAIGAISGLGVRYTPSFCRGGVLVTNIVLRPLAYRLYPAQSSGEEQEVTYGFELACRQEDEAHMRALLLQAMSRSTLTLTALRRRHGGDAQDESDRANKRTGAAGRGAGANGGEIVARSRGQFRELDGSSSGVGVRCCMPGSPRRSYHLKTYGL
jgi:putative Mg2+ transporter-C (MgtC) family protein